MRIWLLIGLFFLSATCSRKQEFARDSDIQKTVPLQEFQGASSITMSDSGKIEWILLTTHMVRENQDDLTKADPVELHYYGGAKEPVSRLTALKGTAGSGRFESFFVEGNVRVVSTHGYKLWAENLKWDKRGNRVESKDRVRFTTKQGDVLTGTGFISDPDLENWKILKNVQGEFQQFEKRMGAGGI